MRPALCGHGSESTLSALPSRDHRALAICLLPANRAFQTSVPVADHLLDPFATGWMLSDTHGDGIADFVSGKVVVPPNPSAAENVAAADIVARMGFASTGLTLPLVIPATQDRNDGPRIWVGRNAVPAQHAAVAGQFADQLQGGNLAVLGHDDAGLLWAAEAFASRAPYIWKVPGDTLSVLGDVVKVKPVGLTYLKGKSGVAKAIFEGSAKPEELTVTIFYKKLAMVHQLVVSGVSAVRSNAMDVEPPATPPTAGAPVPADPEAGPARLDLATLYTMRGLFRGTARMPGSVPPPWPVLPESVPRRPAGRSQVLSLCRSVLNGTKDFNLSQSRMQPSALYLTWTKAIS
jgi:hypothetical protein